MYLFLIFCNEIYKKNVNLSAINFFLFLQNLLELHRIATTHDDANFMDFLETEFLQEQVDAIKEISDHVTNLERVGEGLGVFIFDKELNEQD